MLEKSFDEEERFSLSYGPQDFHFTTPSTPDHAKRSEFDQLFLGQWERAREAGMFNYSVDKVEDKILEGKYHLVAQMNAFRKTKRRTPEEIFHVEQPFNPDKFNFTKIKTAEHLVHLKYIANSSTTNIMSINDRQPSLQGSLVINTAPICRSHSLLVPSLEQRLKQVATLEGVAMAVHSILLSSAPDLRVAFNSLGGYASVNHLHFHLYYFPHKLYIETAMCDQLAGPCYTFKDYYAPGFVFQTENGNVDQLARNIMKVIDLFVKEGIAHNLYMTRGADLREGEPGKEHSTVRVFVWARKFCSGVKDVTYFATAACELAGHVPVYSPEDWDTLNEEDIVRQTSAMCQQYYQDIKPKVAALFTQDGVNSDL